MTKETHCGKFDGKMTEENLFCALPLLLDCWDLGRLKLPLPEVGKSVNDDPRDAPSEVDDLDIQAFN